tara:strand:+ start:3211 stop:4161 length:951 start_codon:yes stop_codon:yes gene_type:complete
MHQHFEDTSKTSGATVIVPCMEPDNPVYTKLYTHILGISGKDFATRRKEAEEMTNVCDEEYIEIVPKFESRNVLFYRTDAYHRGTSVKETKTQLEKLGFTGRDDPRWKNEMFVAAMNHRYQWAGFNAKKYMKYENPPPVPKYWHFAPLTLRSTASAVGVREKLFQILDDLNVNVEAISSFWKYRLQKVCGDAYIDIECHFFKNGSEITVDINLLSGDRFVWHKLAQNIRDIFNGGNSKGKCQKPRVYPLMMSHQLFQMIKHGSMNDKRRAMRSLALSTFNVDIRKIEPWHHKPAGSFLEKEIKQWAEYIKVHRAHL